jgi:hypothetical protein
VAPARQRGSRESHAGAAADEGDGTGGGVGEAAAEPPGRATVALPVAAAERGDHTAEPRVSDRHDLQSPAAGVCLSDGRDGLIQPVCGELAGVGDDGGGLLHGGLGAGPLPVRIPRSSLPIKGRNSPGRRSRAVSRRRVFGSATMGGGVCSTTSLSSGCAGRSSMRRCN